MKNVLQNLILVCCFVLGVSLTSQAQNISITYRCESQVPGTGQGAAAQEAALRAEAIAQVTAAGCTNPVVLIGPDIGSDDFMNFGNNNDCDLAQAQYLIQCDGGGVRSVSFSQLDTQGPVVVEAPNALDQNGQCEGDIVITPPSFTDNCQMPGPVVMTPISTLRNSTGAPGCLNRYVEIITWQAVDACGIASDVYIQTITVNDTTGPNAPADVVNNVQCGDDVPSIADANPGPATDNCDGATVEGVGLVTTNTLNPMCPNSGTVVYTYTYTDLCGNSSTTTVTFNVLDDTDPSFTLAPGIGNASFQCVDEVPPASINDMINVMDNCTEDITRSVADVTTGTGCTASPLVITRTYTATDCAGNEFSREVIYTVIDNVNPIITAPTNIGLGALRRQCGDDILPHDLFDLNQTRGFPTIEDNCSTEGVLLPSALASNLITSPWPAGDERTINEPGVATNLRIRYDDVIVAHPTVCAAPTQPKYRIQRTFTVTDACGNTASATQIINVVDEMTPPVAMVTSDVIDLTVDANCSAVLNASQVERGSTDNCNTEDERDAIVNPYSLNANAFISLNPMGPFTAQSITLTQANLTPGSCPTAITVYMVVRDQCGNQSAVVSKVITLTDDTAPVVTAPNDQTIEGCTRFDVTNGSALPYRPLAFLAPTTITVAQFEAEGDGTTASVADDCAVTISYLDSAPGIACPITFTRTYTITDVCGNVTTVSRLITIDDTINPIVTAPADVTIEGCGVADIAAGLFSGNFRPAFNTNPTTIGLIGFTAAGATASDNCGIIVSRSYQDVQRAGTCPTIVDRTWTVTDRCGNTGTDVQVITIDDTTPPVLACPNDLVGSPDAVPAGLGIEGCTTADITAGNSGFDYSETEVTLDAAGIATFRALTGASVTDQCDFTMTYQDAASGTCPIVVTRTFTATDACDNVSTCTQTIEVYDTTDPIAVCPTTRPIVTLSYNPVTCAFDPAVLPANALAGGNSTDNCDVIPGDNVTETSPATTFTCTQIGINQVILTATDLCGNTNTVSCEVEVVLDRTIANWNNPGPLCPSDIETAIDLNDEVVNAAVVNCGTWSGDFVSADGMFLPNGPGNYSVTYTVPGGGACNDVFLTRVITVLETVVADDVQLTNVDLGCQLPGLVYDLRGMLDTQDNDANGFGAVDGGAFALGTPTGTLSCTLVPNTSTILYNGGTGTVEVSYTIGDCDGVPVVGTAVLTITEQPTGVAVFVPSPICQNDAIIDPRDFVTPAAVPMGWTRTFSLNGAGGNVPLVDGVIINPALISAGTYTLTYTVENGTCSATATQSIVINQAGSPAFTVTSPICETAAPITLTLTDANDLAGDPLTAGNVNWFGQGVTDTGVDATFTPGAAGQYTVCVTVGHPTCAQTQCQEIIVTPNYTAADVALVAGPVSLCLDEDAIIDYNTFLAAGAEFGGTFTATVAGVTGTQLPNGFIYSAGCGSITLTYQFADDCDGPTVSNTLVLNISRKPDVSFSIPSQFCQSNLPYIITAANYQFVGCQGYTATFEAITPILGGDPEILVGGSPQTRTLNAALQIPALLPVIINPDVTAGQYRIRVTLTDPAGICTPVVFEQAVTIERSGSPEFAEIGPLCEGTEATDVPLVLDNVTDDAGDPWAVLGAGLVTWTGTGVTDGPGIQGRFTAPDTDGDGIAGPGVFTVCATVGDPACAATFCRDIIVNPNYTADDVATIAGPIEICAEPGEVIEYSTLLGTTALPGGQFTATVTGLQGVALPEGYSYTGGCGSIVVTYAFANDCEPTVSNPVTININEKPTLTVSTAGVVCQSATGVTIPVLADGCDDYVLTVAVTGTGSLSLPTTTIPYTPGVHQNLPIGDADAGAGVYTATFTLTDPSGRCEPIIVVEQFEIKQAGSPDFVFADLCESDAFTADNLTLTSLGIDLAGENLPANFVTWFGQGVTDNGITATFNPADTDNDGLPGPGVYNVCVTVGDPACAETFCRNITVGNDNPDGSTTLVDDFAMCLLPQQSFNYALLLSEDALPGGTFTAVASGVSITQQPNGFVYNGGCGTVTVTYTLGTADCTTNADDNVVVITLSEKAIVSLSNQGPLCVLDNPITIQNNGTSVVANCTNATGVFTGPGITDAGNGLTASFDPAVAGEGVHTITYTIGDGDCQTVAITTVTVRAAGDATFTATTPLCEGGAAIDLVLSNIHPSLDEDSEVTWFGGTPTGGVVADNGVTGTFTPNTPGIYTVCVMTGDVGCTQVFCQNIEVVAEPPVTTSQELFVACQTNAGGTVALTSLFPGVNNEFFTGNGTITVSGGNGALAGGAVVFNGYGCIEVTWTYDDPLPCNEDRLVTSYIFVTEQPTPSFNMIDQACWEAGGAPFVVTPFVTSPAYTGTVSRVWSISGTDVTAGGIDANTGAFTLGATGTMNVTLTETITTVSGNCTSTPNTCVNTYTQSITVQSGSSLDPTFTADDLTPCINQVVNLTATTPGGTFTGQFVTDNGNGTAIFTAPTTPGEYVVNYTINSSNGCTNSFSLILTVDEVDPTIVCPADLTVSADQGVCTAVVNNIDATATDDCIIAQTTYQLTGATVAAGTGNASGLTFNLGVTTVTYTTTDNAGNTASCSFEVTVEDTELPVITCAAGSPFDRENTVGLCGYVAQGTEFDATATDNCEVASVTHNYGAWGNPNSLAGATFPVGTTTVVWTAVDAAGNTTQCTITIEVEDTENPVFVNCPQGANFTVSLFPGVCDGGAIWSVPVAEDNCPGVVVNQIAGPALGDQLVVGVYDLVYEAVDASGNSVQCSFSITVIDTEGPIVVCPGNVINAGTDAGVCTWTAPAGSLTPLLAVSNCPFTIAYTVTGATTATGVDDASGVTFNQGTSTVTYTVTETASGQVWTCSFDVVVADDEAPVLTGCSAGGLFPIGNQTFGNDAGVCGSLLPGFFDATDNCGLAATAPIVFQSPSGQLFETNLTLALGGYELAATFFEVGQWTYTITVFDLAGNSSVCNGQFLIVDVEVPVITCAAGSPFTRENSVGICGYVAQGTEFDATATDNCSVVSLTHDYGAWGNPNSLAGATFPVGTTNVVWTAVDAEGNVTTCEIEITVEDTEAPTFVNCQDGSVITVSFFAGACEGSPYWAIPVAQDNCPGVVVNQTEGPLPGDFLAAGTYPVSYTAVDASGNEATCSFTVEVLDTEGPVIVCPGNVINKNTDADACSYTPTGNEFRPLLAQSNCPFDVTYTVTGATVANGVDDVSEVVFELGTSRVTYTATEPISGQSWTCFFDVIVSDAQAPAIVCPTVDDTYPTDAGVCEATVTGLVATATDNCTDPVTNITHNSNFADAPGADASGVYPVGVHTVVFTAVDNAGNSSTCSVTFEVIDTENPVITCPTAGLSVTTDPGTCGYTVVGTEFNATATDNCPVVTLSHNYGNWSISNSLAGATFPIGTTNVTWTATDAAGNTATCAIVITVADDEAPVFVNCPDDITVTVGTFVDDCLGGVNFSIPVAADNCDNVVTVRPTANNEITPGSIVEPGDYIVEYEAVDAAGNISEVCNFTITVIDTQEPVVLCPSVDITISVDAGGCTWTSTDIIDPNFTSENCPAVITYTVSGATTASGTGSAAGVVLNFGVNTITYTITETGNGMMLGTCSFDVNVIDLIAPSFTCPTPRQVAGCAGTVPSVITGLIGTDNCNGPVTFTQNPVAGTQFGPNPGDVIIVTVTATDASGNTSTCTVPVTIIDTEMPYFVNCPQDTLIYGTDTDRCSATVNWSIPVAMDNCTAVMAPDQIVQTMGLPPGSVFPVGGPYVIEYTATDNDGNAMTCQWAFYVRDTQEPEILVGKPQDQTVDCDAVPAPLVLNPNDVEDNCTANPTIAFVQNSTQNADQALCAHYNYTLTNIWTVTDQAGNAQVWNQVVTVQDTTAPIITLPLNVTIECNGVFVEGNFVCNPTTGSYAPTGISTGIATAIDNCAPVAFICIEYSDVFEPGNCGFAGIVRRTWTATDPCGNQSSGVQIITIVDTTPPAFTCQDVTINLDADGNATISADDIIVGGVDAVVEVCSDIDDITFQVSQNMFTCEDLGVNEVILVVTDACGNSAACVVNVTIRDTIAPTIFCQGNQIIQLASGECEAYVPFLVANADDNCGVTVSFNPAQTQPFPIGITTVVATATDEGGNTATCSFTIEVREFIPASNTLVCNNAINLSLDGNCEAVLTPDMLLEGNNYRCFDNYCITVTYLTGAPHANLFTLADVGLTFQVMISDCNGSGNACWGIVNIEEKLTPEIECPSDVVIPCNQDPEARNAQGLLLTGEAQLLTCEPGSSISFVDDYTDNGQCATPRARIARIWSVVDVDGNVASCVQNITIESLDLDDVVFPADRVFATAIECADIALDPSLTTPANTGFPTINGVPVNLSGNLCMVSVNVSDEIYDICAGSYEILRTWRVRNMCLPLSPNNPRVHTQIIKVNDTQGPKLTNCPANITISTGANDCVASAVLPLPDQMSDLCSNVTFKATLFGTGTLVQTGSLANGNLEVRVRNLRKGTHVVRYELKDECGNITRCNFNITVQDRTAPVAIAKQNIVISLTPDLGGADGTGKLFATAVDNGSHDNCSSNVRLEIRRKADNAPACDNIGNNNHNNNRTYSNLSNNAPYSVNDTDRGEFVKFCCEDVTALVVDIDGDGVLDAGYHEVLLRVWDDGNMNGIVGDLGNPAQGIPADNFNEVWAYVKVESKIPPIITCPPTANITCDWPIETATNFTPVAGVDFSKTGIATVFSLCGSADLEYRDQFTAVPAGNTCGLGRYTRTFRVIGTSIMCTQTINVGPSTSTQPWTITPPPSAPVKGMPCTGPTAAQISANGPVSVAGPCDVIGVSTSIDSFLFEDGVCKKWRVTYNYMNWCTNEARGPFFRDFVYEDLVKPEIPVCRDTMYEVDANCELRNLTLTKRATDMGGCTQNGWLKWQIFIDTWGDGTIDYEFTSFVAPNTNRLVTVDGVQRRQIYVAPTTNGGTVSITIPETFVGKYSKHKIDWKVSDGCHNEEICREEFTIQDKKAPTPYCVSISTALMTNGQVEVWAKDHDRGSFDNCTEQEDLLFTFTSAYPIGGSNVAGVPSPGIVTPAQALTVDHYFDATTGAAIAVFPAPAGSTVPAEYARGSQNPGRIVHLWKASTKSSAKVYVCADGDLVNVQMYVHDKGTGLVGAERNSDFCEVTLRIVDNQGACNNGMNVGGRIVSEEGNNVPGIMTSLLADLPEYPRTNVTGTDGKFEFRNVPGAVEYELSADHNVEHNKGVTTLDIVLIQRHILNIERLATPYKLIAADANNNGTITASDIVDIRKVVLGINDYFTNNTSWVFIDKNHQFANPASPFPYTTGIDLGMLMSESMDNEFVAVKIGDVNGSASQATNGDDAGTRASKAVRFNAKEGRVVNGDLVSIEVTSENFEEVLGFQYSLATKGLRFVGASSGTLTVGESNVGQPSANILTMSWNNATAVTADENEVLFTLNFVATENGMISSMISMNSAVTRSEAYVTDQIETVGASLSVRAETENETVSGYKLGQNEPNPFTTETIVRYEVPSAGEVKFTVLDVAGRVVLSKTADAVKGENTIIFNRSEMGNASGVLIYQMESADFVGTKKMIIVD